MTDPSNASPDEGSTPDAENTHNPFDNYSHGALTEMLLEARHGINCLEQELREQDERNAEVVFSYQEEVRRLSQQLEGSDPRLEEFWRKAQEYAQSVGFCSEFDKIAEHLGGPARSLAWSGYVTTTVSLTVQAPVSGIDSVEAVNDHNVTYEVDTWELLDAVRETVRDLSHYELDYEVDSASVEITDTEPAED